MQWVFNGIVMTAVIYIYIWRAYHGIAIIPWWDYVSFFRVISIVQWDYTEIAMALL